MTRTPDADVDYWAVIFTNQRSLGDDEAYEATAERMVELGSTMPGFLGIESTRNAQGLGITVSYWRSEDDLLAWKQVSEHAAAQAKGRSDWYSRYTTRIARVTREYSFESSDTDDHDS